MRNMPWLGLCSPMQLPHAVASLMNVSKACCLMHVVLPPGSSTTNIHCETAPSTAVQYALHVRSLLVEFTNPHSIMTFASGAPTSFAVHWQVPASSHVTTLRPPWSTAKRSSPKTGRHLWRYFMDFIQDRGQGMAEQSFKSSFRISYYTAYSKVPATTSSSDRTSAKAAMSED